MNLYKTQTRLSEVGKDTELPQKAHAEGKPADSACSPLNSDRNSDISTFVTFTAEPRFIFLLAGFPSR